VFFAFNYKLFYVLKLLLNYTCLISIQKMKKHKYLYKILYS